MATPSALCLQPLLIPQWLALAFSMLPDDMLPNHLAAYPPWWLAWHLLV